MSFVYATARVPGGERNVRAGWIDTWIGYWRHGPFDCLLGGLWFVVL